MLRTSLLKPGVILNMVSCAYVALDDGWVAIICSLYWDFVFHFFSMMSYSIPAEASAMMGKVLGAFSVSLHVMLQLKLFLGFTSAASLINN